MMDESWMKGVFRIAFAPGVCGLSKWTGGMDRLYHDSIQCGQLRERTTSFVAK